MSRLLTIVTASLLLGAPAFAQPDEAAMAPGIPDSSNAPVNRGGSLADGDLFTGTSLNDFGTNNDVFGIDVGTDIATALFSGEPIWGATYDVANSRILYTTEGGADSGVGGAPLYAMTVPGGTPTLLGVINDGLGTDFRIDGLAMSGGTLYGTRAAAAADGLYTIDLTTFTATQVFAYTDSISGIDADPDTGIIYGVNDSTGQLVTIDPAGTISTVAAYPDMTETDIDGIGVGNGFAYLIPDDDAPGLIYVYDLGTGTFTTPLTAPWGAAADTFSGGAVVAIAAPPTPVIEVPTLSTLPLALLALILAAAAVVVVRRRAEA